MERKEARVLGLKQYETGRACKDGHIAPRWTSTGFCTVCSKARYDTWRESGKAATWREENATRIRSQQAQYREIRRLQRNDAARDYYATHADERAAYQRRYLIANRAAVYARLHKRRARKQCATPPWFGELDELVMIEAAGLCALRKRTTGTNWQIDHAVPLQARTACGLHCAANIQVIPQPLNAAKSNRMWLTEPLEWLAHV